jgi:hypothetical protein
MKEQVMLSITILIRNVTMRKQQNWPGNEQWLSSGIN